MKKYIYILGFVGLGFGAEYKIASIDGEHATIKTDSSSISDANATITGRSCLVFRDTQSDKYIVSRCEVDTPSSIKLMPYVGLEQNEIPTLQANPKVGDMVKIGIYDQRKLLIAPSLESYNSIIGSSSGYLHSDLFASQLHDKGELQPKREHFESFCQDYSVGVIEFAITNTLVRVDCGSFKVIDTKEIKPYPNNQKPFYHRFEKIEKGLFNLEGEIGDFDTYYKALLEIK